MMELVSENGSKGEVSNKPCGCRVAAVGCAFSAGILAVLLVIALMLVCKKRHILTRLRLFIDACVVLWIVFRILSLLLF